FLYASQAHFWKTLQPLVPSTGSTPGRIMTPDDSSDSATMESQASDLRGLADTARERARALAEEGKKTTAQQIGNVAGAIRGAARELEQQMPQGAELIRGAAATLESGAR